MTKEIQMTSIRFTKNDMAEYPFLKENAEYIKNRTLKIEDLANPELDTILERAKERVEEAILQGTVERKYRNVEIEITSFPVALMLAIATGSSFIKKRYALAEAKQTFEDLKNEDTKRILEIAQNLGWKLNVNNCLQSHCAFAVNFIDYLRNATHLRNREWKLVNRVMSNGKVFLSLDKTARLLSEEVRRNIEKRLEVDDLPDFPTKIAEIAKEIKILCADTIGRTDIEEVPQIMVQSAFPPCISALYVAFSSGRHLSHIGRFTLTSFLVNVGMSTDQLIELFRNISDFNEKMTRYQVEHIAGEIGSRTRYIPPKCDTLKTHGVCTNPDELCRRVRHPLGYYRIRLGRERKSR